MDTTLALQDPGLTSFAGRSSTMTGNNESNGLFASTLQQELNDPGSEAADESDANPTADLAPRSLRKDLGDWLRSLQAGATPAAALPKAGSGETPVATEDHAATTAAMLTGSSRFNPFPDDAEPEAAGEQELLDPLDDAMVTLEPATTNTATPAVTPALQPVEPHSTAGILPAHFKVARTTSTSEQSSSTTALQEAAPADGAMHDKSAATSQLHEHRWSGQKSAWQDGTPLASATSVSSEDPQQMQTISFDSTLRFIAPQAVLAPELDQSFAQQQTPGLTGLRPVDAGSTFSAPTASGAEALTFSLQSEVLAGTEGWGEDIGNHITWLSDQKISKAELTLHPAELGALDITINSENDRVTVTIVTRNEAARELLQDNLPRLAELLRNNGLALEQGSVSQQSAGDRGSQPGSTPGDAPKQETNTTAGNELPRLRSALLHQGQIDHYV